MSSFIEKLQKSLNAGSFAPRPPVSGGWRLSLQTSNGLRRRIPGLILYWRQANVSPVITSLTGHLLSAKF